MFQKQFTSYHVFAVSISLLLGFLSFPALAKEENKQDDKKQEERPIQRDLENTNTQNLHKSLQKLEGNKKITGQLPKSWQDDSAWADLQVDYQFIQGNKKKRDDDFIRARISDWKKGQAQLRVNLPSSGEELIYTVIIEARSSTYNDLVMTLRQRQAPYRAYWTRRMSLTPQWYRYESTFSIREKKHELALLLDLGRHGELDIRKIYVQRMTEAGLRQQLRKNTQNADVPANLVRHSRFPLGLQAGWAFSPELDRQEDVTLVPDLSEPPPPEVDPTGAVPPLLVVTAPPYGPQPADAPERKSRPISIYSAPFAVERLDRPHTAGIYVKGPANRLFINVYGPGEKRMEPLKNSNQWFNKEKPEEWQRLTVTFQPELLHELYVLKIEGQGQFWMDGFMVSEGEQPKEFTMRNESEVHLATTHPANVVFSKDEKQRGDLTIRYAVVDPPKDSLLRVNFADIYGNQDIDKVTDLKGGKLLTGEFQFQFFDETPFGQYRVESWVEDQKKERVSPFAEILVNSLHRPHYLDRDAPDSPFGAHFFPTDRQVLAAKSIGINWARLYEAGGEITRWTSVQPEKDQWVWHDHLVRRYRQNQISLLGVLFTVPRWAAVDGPKDPGGGADEQFQPRDFQDFTNYATTTAEHFQENIGVWQIWQEPAGWTLFDKYLPDENWRQKYRQSKTQAQDYLRLSRETWDAFQQKVPDARLVGLNASWRSNTREWTETMADLNAPAYADILGLNTFWTPDRGEFVDPRGEFHRIILDDFLRPLRSTYSEIPDPLWVTQASPNFSTVDTGFYRYTIEHFAELDKGTLQAEADRIPRFGVSLLSQDVEKIFLYGMHKSLYLGGTHGNSWLTLVTEDLALNPAACAHSAMAWFLENRRFIMVQEVVPEVFVYFFECRDAGSEECSGRPRSVAVIAPTDLAEPWRFKNRNGFDAHDLFGNPIQNDYGQKRSVIYVESSMPTDKFYERLRNVMTEK